MRFRPVVAVLLSVLLLHGCGDPPPAAPSGPEPPPATDAVVSGDARPPAGGRPQAPAGAAATSAGAGTAQGGGSRVVRWIKDLGIMGGAGGTGPVAAYGQLSDGECLFMLPLDAEQFTARELRLYRGAAHACLAAFHGEPGRWAQAAADFAALSGQTGGFNCLDRNAYSLLKSLVETHRQAPTARLVRGGGADGAAPACPRILDVVPNHGPAAGGYPVRLVGEHLPARAVVEWSGRRFEVSTKDGREATLTVPPLGDAQIASIWVDGWPYGLYGAVEFTYDPGPTPAAT